MVQRSSADFSGEMSDTEIILCSTLCAASQVLCTEAIGSYRSGLTGSRLCKKALRVPTYSQPCSLADFYAQDTHCHCCYLKQVWSRPPGMRPWYKNPQAARRAVRQAKGWAGAGGAWRAWDGEEEGRQHSTESSCPETFLCCYLLWFKPIATPYWGRNSEGVCCCTVSGMHIARKQIFPHQSSEPIALPTAYTEKAQP